MVDEEERKRRREESSCEGVKGGSGGEGGEEESVVVLVESRSSRSMVPRGKMELLRAILREGDKNGVSTRRRRPRRS